MYREWPYLSMRNYFSRQFQRFFELRFQTKTKRMKFRFYYLETKLFASGSSLFRVNKYGYLYRKSRKSLQSSYKHTRHKILVHFCIKWMEQCEWSRVYIQCTYVQWTGTVLGCYWNISVTTAGVGRIFVVFGMCEH